MSEFTPAPWKANRHSVRRDVPEKWEQTLVARVFPAGDVPLIAAAPDLYAALLAADRALRHLPFHIDECGSCDRIAHLTHEIADALAKADGRE